MGDSFVKAPLFYAISGLKNTGKTTLLTGVIAFLTNKGYKVAAIKHDGHDFIPDVPGTDSFRHREAGAYGSAVYSKNRFMVTKECEAASEILLAEAFPEADVILLEGFKGRAYPGYVCDFPTKIPDVEMIGKGIIQRMESRRLESFMDRIQLPKEGCEIVREYPMSEEQYEEWKQLFHGEEEQFFHRLEEATDKEQLLLCLYVRFAVDIHQEYNKRKIAPQIYYDNFKDIAIWYKQCMKKKGKCGLIEERWLALPLRLHIFRLGRLQFEWEIMSDGTGILHVHIPEGETLTPEVCQESFEQADAFFDEQYTVFDCESWLLSPNLYEVLEEDSNILQFQQRFQIQKITYPFRQAEERVFGFVAEDKTQYPKDGTRLQKKIWEYVQDGKDIGIGYGIMERTAIYR